MDGVVVGKTAAAGLAYHPRTDDGRRRAGARVELIAGAALRRRLADDPPLLEGLRDPETQIQMNGVDLTLAEVSKPGPGPGRVDFDNRTRRIPAAAPIPPDADGVWRLAAGSYWVRYHETVNIPAEVFALGRTRSSLLRCGAHLGTALWDSGYSGRSGSLLVVSHPDGIELTEGARIVQLVFFRLAEPAERTYAGAYQNE